MVVYKPNISVCAIYCMRGDWENLRTEYNFLSKYHPLSVQPV